MYCNQCEQSVGPCSKVGVCGKKPDVAALQDLLTYALKGLAQVTLEARARNVDAAAARRFTLRALFATLTNVNFDPKRLAGYIRTCATLRDALAAQLPGARFSGPAALAPAETLDALVRQGETHLLTEGETNPDILSLKQTVLYGLRGLGAYADHAAVLGQEDDLVYAYIEKALAALLRTDLGLEDWIGLTMECGKVNLRAMELLDAGNTGTYGHPVPTEVPLGHRKGKAIVVSGHDLRDLENLLKQTEGKGISVYTHGEMLPTHGYPGLKKYAHFYGHYGTAWQNQVKEFAALPGAILMTTNCIQKPSTYQDNIFTSGEVGWPGATHIPGEPGERDFTPVVERALALPGFPDDEDKGSVMVGFARNAVMGVAGKVIEAVKSGAIRHFFLVAGCDGAKPGRNYYTEFVEKVPADCVVLTLACGKFRFFDKKLGDIGGIPRLLDIGQCNDAYSAIQIALALSEAFKVGVNELPLSMVLSWYEQKAVVILLTLLALGIKNIRLGPTLPSFVSPAVLAFLVENFDIKPITTPDADLKAILG